jgi:hypothetical protein
MQYGRLDFLQEPRNIYGTAYGGVTRSQRKNYKVPRLLHPSFSRVWIYLSTGLSPVERLVCGNESRNAKWKTVKKGSKKEDLAEQDIPVTEAREKKYVSRTAHSRRLSIPTGCSTCH